MTGEMHLVALRQLGFVPFAHRGESSHDGELVPHHTAAGGGNTHESVAHKGAVVVDSIAALGITVTVVVGDKDKGTVGADGTDGVDKLQIALAEDRCVEVGTRGVVDAYTEDDEVGTAKT